MGGASAYGPPDQGTKGNSQKVPGSKPQGTKNQVAYLGSMSKPQSPANFRDEDADGLDQGLSKGGSGEKPSEPNDGQQVW